MKHSTWKFIITLHYCFNAYLKTGETFNTIKTDELGSEVMESLILKRHSGGPTPNTLKRNFEGNAQ